MKIRDKNLNYKQSLEKAVALRYDQEKDASPRVIAKGEGLIAEQIRAVAKENNIPIREDSDLVELLAQIDLNNEIPSELYKAVAEILSWLYRANIEKQKENSP